MVHHPLRHGRNPRRRPHVPADAGAAHAVQTLLPAKQAAPDPLIAPASAGSCVSALLLPGSESRLEYSQVCHGRCIWSKRSTQMQLARRNHSIAADVLVLHAGRAPRGRSQMPSPRPTSASACVRFSMRRGRIAICLEQSRQCTCVGISISHCCDRQGPGSKMTFATERVCALRGNAQPAVAIKLGRHGACWEPAEHTLLQDTACQI